MKDKKIAPKFCKIIKKNRIILRKKVIKALKFFRDNIYNFLTIKSKVNKRNNFNLEEAYLTFMKT